MNNCKTLRIKQLIVKSRGFFKRKNKRLNLDNILQPEAINALNKFNWVGDADNSIQENALYWDHERDFISFKRELEKAND